VVVCTRIFTLSLQNALYQSCTPLDHPATDASLLDKAVSHHAVEGGDLVAWVVSVDDVPKVEKCLGRQAVDGYTQN